MNTNIATEIIELLCQKLGIAFDWTAEEMWPYIQQLMNELAIGRFWANTTLAIIFSIIFALVLISSIAIYHKGGYENESTGIFMGILGGGSFAIGASVAIYYAVMWKTMPTIMAYKWIMENLKR